MQLSQWFHKQLEGSAEGFLWAVEQIPRERLYIAPRPNRWPVARLVYHLVCYEQRIGLSSMQQWLGGPRPVVGSPEEDGEIEEASWNNGEGHDVPTMIEEFKAVRAQQLALLPQFSEQSWHEERDAIWGRLPLQWVVTKTYQHTLEHTDEVLRNYLWWR